MRRMTKLAGVTLVIGCTFASNREAAASLFSTLVDLTTVKAEDYEWGPSQQLRLYNNTDRIVLFHVWDWFGDQDLSVQHVAYPGQISSRIHIPSGRGLSVTVYVWNKKKGQWVRKGWRAFPFSSARGTDVFLELYRKAPGELDLRRW